MSTFAIVQIIGAPIACQEGYQDAWRDAAEWAAGELGARFGESVQVKYYDLFDSDCPTLPPQAQLPIILVNDEYLPTEGKISIPAIRKKLEGLGLKANL